MEISVNQQSIFLGIVTRIFSGTVSRAVIEPNYRANDKRSAWEPVHDQQSAFPNRGTISWLNPPVTDVTEGSLWEFRVTEQPTYERTNPAHDQYRLAPPPTPVRDVIRLNGKLDEVRQQVVVQGLSLPFSPSSSVLILLDTGQWLGPVPLARRDNGAWYADPQQLESPIDTGSSLKVVELRINGAQRIVPAPGQQGGSRRGQIDWASDARILERALRGLRQVDSTSGQAVVLTKRSIAETIERLGIGDSEIDWPLEQQRLKRAQAIIQRVEQHRNLAELVQGAVLALPTSKRTLEAAIVEAQREVEAASLAAVEAARREAERDAEQIRESARKASEVEGEGARQRLAAIGAEGAAAEEALAAIRRQIAAEEAALRQARDDLASQLATREEQLAQLERSLDDRLREILDRPERVLADIAIVGALQRALGRDEARASGAARHAGQIVHASATYRPFLPFIPSKAKPLVGPPQSALKSLYPHFRSNLLPTRIARILHAACLSGAVPIIVGDGADLALDLYGDVVAGGRVLRIPVTPTMLEPGDLFGRIDPAQRRFVPHAGGLFDVLHAAQASDDLTLVVLDGINRAPIESLILPILACYAAAWTGQRHSRLPLVHPGAVEPDDPALHVSPLSWPRQVILTATLVEGTTTLPLPSRLWDAALLLHLDGYYTESSEDDPQASTLAPVLPSAVSAVAGGQWRAWQDGLRSIDLAPCAQLLADATEATLWIRGNAQRIDSRFFAALRSLQIEPGRALEEIGIQGLIPQCAAEQEGLLVETLSTYPWHSELFDIALERVRPWLQ